MIRAVIFDMDGVLFNSSAVHASAFEQVLREFDIADFRYEDIAGMRTDEAFRRIFSRTGIPHSEADVIAATGRKRQRAISGLHNPALVAEGCRNTLVALKRTCKLALVSSASQQSVAAFLEISDTSALFDVVIDGESVMHAKPHPEIYLKAMEALGAVAAECIAVEDAESGIQSALSAGMRVVGFIGTLSRDRLLQCGSLVAIKHIAEMENIVCGAL